MVAADTLNGRSVLYPGYRSGLAPLGLLPCTEAPGRVARLSLMGFLQGVACAPPATRFLVRLSCLPPGSGAADFACPGLCPGAGIVYFHTGSTGFLSHISKGHHSPRPGSYFVPMPSASDCPSLTCMCQRPYFSRLHSHM